MGAHEIVGERIFVEPAVNHRTCHNCGAMLPAGTFHVAAYLRKPKSYGDRRNICQKCLLELYEEVKAQNNKGVNLDT